MRGLSNYRIILIAILATTLFAVHVHPSALDMGLYARTLLLPRLSSTHAFGVREAVRSVSFKTD